MVLGSRQPPIIGSVEEVAEELAITVLPQDLAPALLADDWPDGQIVLILYTANMWQGEISGLEGQQWGWFTLAQMAALPLTPMDRSFAARLAR